MMLKTCILKSWWIYSPLSKFIVFNCVTNHAGKDYRLNMAEEGKQAVFREIKHSIKFMAF